MKYTVSLLRVLLVLLVCSVVSRSQDIELTYGDNIPTSRSSFVVYASKVANNLLVVRNEGKGNDNMIVQVFDQATLKLVKSVEIFGNDSPNSLNSKTFSFNSFLSVGNKLLFFVETYVKNEEKHYLQVQAIDKDGLFLDQLITIDEITAKRRSNSGSFMLCQSPDSSKFLVIENPPDPKSKQAPEAFGFKVYDINLTNIANLLVTIPLADKDVGIEDYYLDNEGFVYLLVNVTQRRKDVDNGQSLVYYMLYRVDPRSSQISELKISFDSKCIESISLRLQPSTGKIFCAGMYSNLTNGQRYGEDIDGMFFIRINPAAMEVEISKLNPIDKEMVSQLEYGRTNKPLSYDEGISLSFRVTDFEPNADGSALVIAENRYFNTSTYCSPSGACITTFTFYRENLFIVDLATDGSIHTMTDIPKSQESCNDNGLYSSYFLMSLANKKVLVFNDNAQNISPEVKSIRDVESMSNPSRACLVGSELRDDGSYTKFMVHNNRQKQTAFIPENIFKVADGVYIAPFASNPRGVFPFMKRTPAGIARLKVK